MHGRARMIRQGNPPAEVESAIRADRMHRISEVDAPGYLPREQAKDAEAQDRAKAPSMFDVLLANGLWVALIVVIVYLASLYAGWVPTWSGWPSLVAGMAI
jgi:hypothetical protein